MIFMLSALAGAPLTTWVEVTAEAPKGPVRIPGCWSRRASWSFEKHTDQSILATFDQGYMAAGMEPLETYATTAILKGEWKDGVLVLTGERVTVVTNHGAGETKETARDPLKMSLTRKGNELVGTVNGVPLRLVVGDLTGPKGDCGAPPP